MSLLKSIFGSGGSKRDDGPGPIIVGGTGGSGTRAVHAVLEKSGVFMGSRVNHAGDAMDFEPFLDGFINLFLLHGKSLDHEFGALPEDIQKQTGAYLEAAFSLYDRDRPVGSHWGWKNPRSMFALPALHRVFKNMSFIQLVRDGRDMALSENQNQVIKHYAALFEAGPTIGTPEQSIELWATANSQAADWAERELKERYLLVSYERLCADPEGEIKKIIAFADLQSSPDIQSLSAEVVGPTSLGRWKSMEREQLGHLNQIAEPALSRFGYTS